MLEPIFTPAPQGDVDDLIFDGQEQAHSER